MSLTINGKEFFNAKDIVQELGIARQTLWRWRNDGKIPAGSRYRDRQILFTGEEVEEIRLFANKIEPAKLKKAK